MTEFMNKSFSVGMAGDQQYRDNWEQTFARPSELPKTEVQTNNEPCTAEDQREALHRAYAEGYDEGKLFALRRERGPLTGAELAEKHGYEEVPHWKKDPFVRPMNPPETHNASAAQYVPCAGCNLPAYRSPLATDNMVIFCSEMCEEDSRPAPTPGVASPTFKTLEEADAWAAGYRTGLNRAGCGSHEGYSDGCYACRGGTRKGSEHPPCRGYFTTPQVPEHVCVGGVLWKPKTSGQPEERSAAAGPSTGNQSGQAGGNPAAATIPTPNAFRTGDRVRVVKWHEHAGLGGEVVGVRTSSAECVMVKDDDGDTSPWARESLEHEQATPSSGEEKAPGEPGAFCRKCGHFTDCDACSFDSY